jgi:hypothetical protein
MLSVCMCASFHAHPKEVSLRAVQRIMRYLVYAPNMGFGIPRYLPEREIGSHLFLNDFGG